LLGDFGGLPVGIGLGIGMTGIGALNDGGDGLSIGVAVMYRGGRYSWWASKCSQTVPRVGQKQSREE
jgi:hypothetical protein